MSKVIGLDPKAERTFIPKCDRELPENEQIKFKVRLLTISESAAIRDNQYEVKGLGKERTEKIKVASSEIKVLEMCLLGWDNFLDDGKKPIVFNKANFEFIPSNIRSEICDFCKGDVEEEEIKK